MHAYPNSLSRALFPNRYNVLRIQNGKNVEIWNHRHDIDTPQTLQYTLRGLLYGLLIALLPLIWAIRLRRRLSADTTS